MSLLLVRWYPGSGVVLIVSIPDLCTLNYFGLQCVIVEFPGHIYLQMTCILDERIFVCQDFLCLIRLW